MKAVLGSNPLLWLWPQPQSGTGLSYPVNADGESEDDWAGAVHPEQVVFRGGGPIRGPEFASGSSTDTDQLQARLRGHLRADDIV